MEKSGKVNPAILYKNELNPEKQTITHKLYGLKLPRGQVWKIMIQVKKDNKSSAHALNSYVALPYGCLLDRIDWINLKVQNQTKLITNSFVLGFMIFQPKTETSSPII